MAGMSRLNLDFRIENCQWVCTSVKSTSIPLVVRVCMFYWVFLLQSSFHHCSDWACGCSLKSSIIIKEINKSPFPYKTKLANKQIKPHRMLVVIMGYVLWWFPVVSWFPQFSPQVDCRQVDHLALGYSCFFWIMLLHFHPISKWLAIAICCFYHLPESWQSKFLFGIFTFEYSFKIHKSCFLFSSHALCTQSSFLCYSIGPQANDWELTRGMHVAYPYIAPYHEY